MGCPRYASCGSVTDPRCQISRARRASKAESCHESRLALQTAGSGPYNDTIPPQEVHQMTSLKDQIVLITGGGSGMGLASAKLLLEQGRKGRHRRPEPGEACRRGQIARLRRQALDACRRRLDPRAGEGPRRRDREEVRPDRHSRQQRRHELEEASLPRADAGELEAGDRRQSRRGILLHPLCDRTDAGAEERPHHQHQQHRRPQGDASRRDRVCGQQVRHVGGFGLGLHAEEKDIRVTNIHPGEVDTPILDNRPTPLSKEHRESILKAEDVARAVLFVAQQPVHVSIPELVIKPVGQMFI